MKKQNEMVSLAKLRKKIQNKHWYFTQYFKETEERFYNGGVLVFDLVNRAINEARKK